MTAGASIAKRQSDVRGHNLALVLHQVHLRGEISRAALTELTGLNRSTIGTLVGDLRDLGLVLDSRPTGGTKVGRPSHLVTARADGPFTIAVAIDVGRVVVALVGLGGAIRGRTEVGLGSDIRPDRAVEVIDALASRLERGLPRGARPLGVGVSLPGTVQSSDGLVGSAPNFGWVDVPMAEMLADRMTRRHPGLGVRVGNDADLGARAEHLRGAGRQVDDLVYLCGTVGVGAGIIVGGVPLPTARGHGGELGHMVVQLDGPRCRCGGRGCFEALVGGEALCALAGSAYRDGVDPAARVLTDARAGQPDALGAVRVVAERIGTGLATIVRILDPRMIVVGGRPGQIYQLCRDDAERAMSRHLIAADSQVSIASPGLGGDSSLFGAAELAFDALVDRTLQAGWLGSGSGSGSGR